MSTSIRELRDALEEFRTTPASYSLDVKVSLTVLVLRKLGELGWSQKQLADAMGRPESFVSRILHSDENCKISTIGNLLHALGVRAKLVESVQATVRETCTRPALRILKRDGTYGNASIKEQTNTSAGDITVASSG